MSQTRLSDRAMISIENKHAKKLDVLMLVKLFAADQIKKKFFLL